MIRKMFVIGLIFVVAVFAATYSYAQNDLTYSGSATIGMGVLEAGARTEFDKKTGIKFKAVEMPGSGKGIKALLEGKVTLAGASRTLEADEKRQKLLGHVIGYDAIAVFVNKSNPVANLTKAQLKGIYTGEIKNWKDVGGKDAPIAVVTEISGQQRATTLAFQEMVMDKAPLGKGFKEIDQPKDLIVEAANNADAVCAVSAGLLASLSPDLQKQVKIVTVNGVEPNNKNIRSGAYLISRPLLLVTQGLAKGNVKKFIDFMLSREGQEIVGKNFVPVKR